jgi:hypothetical protein
MQIISSQNHKSQKGVIVIRNLGQIHNSKKEGTSLSKYHLIKSGHPIPLF